MIKYVVIQCAEAHHHKLAEIFNEIRISSYCEIPVDGFMKNVDGNYEISNWFGSSKSPYRYIKSCTFLEEEKANQLLERIKTFNDKAEGISPINAYVLPVEKYV